jgi:hypothetical protein
VIESAETKLDIMVDYCGYGHFSSPALFRSYLTKLIEKHQLGVAIRMIVYGPRVSPCAYDEANAQLDNRDSSVPRRFPD